jgi:5-methylcytosine-specific restriction endonuclease McrA
MPHADPEARQRYNRAYKREHRWRYRRTQKIWDATRHANERSAAFGCSGVVTAAEVEAILAAGRCHHCGQPVDFMDMTLDHVVPMSARGLNRPENIMPSCARCNHLKSGVPPMPIGRWSRKFDACSECGTSARPHAAHGLCNACYIGQQNRPTTREGRAAQRA